MLGYRSKLQRDLTLWQEKGWVSEAGASEIRKDIAKRGGMPGMVTVLAIVGVVLLGFAAMTFVAANWAEMSRLARVVLLVCLLWASYAGAFAAWLRKAPIFSHAAILLGVALFGANIMLISQMYHLDGHPPNAVLLWACGGLLAGTVLRSAPALALTTLLFGLWTSWEIQLARYAHAVHWPYLIALAATAGAIYWIRWRSGFHFIAVSISLWLLSLGYVLDDGGVHLAVAVIAIIVLIAALALERRLPLLRQFERPTAAYALFVAFGALWALQFIDNAKGGLLLGLAIATLALLTSAMALGERLSNKALVWIGYIAFSVEMLSLYFKTLGTLLGTAAFFLVAGLLVIALSLVAWGLHRWVASDGSGPVEGRAP